MRPLDHAALQATGDTEFGAYTVRGKSLLLTYPIGETETLDKTGEGWRAARREYFATGILSDGTPLSGTISSIYGVGFGGGSNSVGGMTTQWSTTFHPDGSYEGSSCSGVFGHFFDAFGNLNGGFAAGAEGGEGGRNEVRDGLVTRYPAAGSESVRSLACRIGDGIMIGNHAQKP